MATVKVTLIASFPEPTSDGGDTGCLPVEVFASDLELRLGALAKFDGIGDPNHA